MNVLFEINPQKSLFQSDVKALEEHGVELIDVSDTLLQNEQEMITALCTYDVIVTCHQHEWTREILSKATMTKLIIRVGKGVDNVDIEAAKDNGILVANTGSSNAAVVAEHTVALLLAATHRLPECDKNLHNGDWEHIIPMHEIRSRVIGLVGFGAIPQYVAEMLSGFHPKKILAYDPFPNLAAAERLNVEFVSFDELISESNIICIHVPLFDSTYHMFNKKAFQEMQDDVIIVSISRGQVVDENALYESLVDGKIQWAAMDVFEEEPLPADNRLLKLNNVFGTPHSAAHSYEATQESIRVMYQQLLEYSHGETPHCVLNR